MNEHDTVTTAKVETPSELSPAPVRLRRLRRFMSFKNIGAIYVWIVLIVVFSFWAPATFPSYETVKQVLNQNAITGLVALALVLPLSAGVFDLSVGYALGLGNTLIAYLLVTAGMNLVVAILLTLLASIAIGLGNALVVVTARIDSFIGTLATGTLLTAGVIILTGQSEITGPQLTSSTFTKVANYEVFGITLSVVYLLVIAFAIWFVLEHTVIGRWFYATGFNDEASRLAGIPVRRLRFSSLLISALISGGVGGIVVTSAIGSGSSTVGPPLLLPAFASAFLGATQLRQGRFNAWGTLIAVMMLGTGTAGLGLAGTPPWAPSVFIGVVLLMALAVTRVERTV